MEEMNTMNIEMDAVESNDMIAESMNVDAQQDEKNGTLGLLIVTAAGAALGALTTIAVQKAMPWMTTKFENAKAKHEARKTAKAIKKEVDEFNDKYVTRPNESDDEQ